MKRHLIGTWAGDLLFAARSRAEIGRLAFGRLEQGSMLANDALADRLIVRLTQPGAAFLDVGAHIGSILAGVRRHVPGARIFAVEADREKAAFLMRKFPDIRLFDCAVGDRAGRATFYRDLDNPGFSSLIAPDRAGVETIEVEIRRLDDLLPGEEIDVIKIDIEGAELAALEGGAGMIARGQPTIMFESNPASPDPSCPDRAALWDWFDAAGYEVVAPDRLAHDAPPMSRETFIDAHHYPRRSHNFFAVARGRRTEIRDRARAILGIAP